MNTKFLRKDLDALKRRSEAINRVVTLVVHAYNVAADVVKENNGKTLNRRLATAIDARLLGAFGTINGFPAIRCSLERVCGELNPMLVKDQVRTYKCYYPALSPWEARREAAIAEITGSGK